MNIYQKLIEVRKEVPYLKKESKGFNYDYNSSSQVLGSVKKKMDELGLILEPEILNQEVVEFKTDKGKRQFFTKLEMTMTWVNAEKPDEKIIKRWAGQGADDFEKGIGKATTYAEKYFLLKYFNIPTDKDDPDAFQSKAESKTVKRIQQTKKPDPKTRKPGPQKITEQSIRSIEEYVVTLGLSQEILTKNINKLFKKNKLEELTEREAKNLIVAFEAKRKEGENNA